MKPTFTLLVLGLGGALLATSAQTARPLSVSVSPSHLTLKTGSHVYVTVRLSNTSDHEINLGTETFVYGGVDARFQYDCRNENGISVTREYPVMGSMGDRPMIILKPGMAHTEKIDIGPACDLSAPGEYHVQLSRAIPGDQNDPAKSNEIIVTVTP